MKAIIKRELSSYFNSAIGYIVLAVFCFFSGIYFYFFCIYKNSSSLSSVFSNMLMIVLFVVPIITMKSFAEEKRQKTDQALLTSPVSLFEIVMGKFLSAFILYLLCVAIFLVYTLVICFFTTPEWSVIFCTLLGMLIMGGALIAIDIFISAMTESQVIAAVVGIGAGLFIYMLDSIANLINAEFFANILRSLSFNQNFSNFTYGILNLKNAVFFISIITVFLFLTIRVFEKKRLH